MGILENLRNRVQQVNDGMRSGEIVRDVVVRHPSDILDLQKRQLFQGLAANGEDIRPYYSEDLKPGGYFLICNESDGMDAAGLKFEKIIDGMKCHTVEEIEKALKAAGFSMVRADHHKTKPWITVIAEKRA